MQIDTWLSLETQFHRWPQTKASPAIPADFDNEMRDYPFLDQDYREFVLRYGGGIVGPNPIYGCKTPEWMGSLHGNTTVLDVNRWFRTINWPGIETWLIFSVDQGGNPIGFKSDNTVWISDMLDFAQIVQIATNFEDYLLKWCLKLRQIEDYQ